MKWKEVIESIETRDDFLKFVAMLLDDFHNDKQSWENDDLSAYLFALHRWTADMDGYFANSGKSVEEPSWKLFATILYAAKMYE